MLPCPSCQRAVLHAFLDSLPITSSVKPTFTSYLIPLARQFSRTCTGAAAAQEISTNDRGSSKEPYKNLQDNANPLTNKGWRLKKPDLIKELHYLNDPLKLAQHVINLLHQNKAVEAVDLIRAASRRMPCTVSWNHIIDDAMKHGRVNAAVKFYNEMKKRAQPPDAHTYTTLLRGLAATKYPQNVSRALLIYNSMYAENSPVKPNIIHTNAMLKVCALYGDLDSLFGVAAKLPTEGRGAPDKWTYTTIFEAIRNELLSFLVANSASAIKLRERKRQESLLQGRRIWGDLVERLRKGAVSVDEQLACSMGRLLLLGTRPEDFDDVLSLLEQTMGIPRQIPRLGHPDRKTHLKAVQMNTLDGKGNDMGVDHDQDQVIESSTSLLPSTVDPVAYSQAPGSEFDSMPASFRSFATPGRSTLSLVFDACIRMRLSSVANAYRVLLTSPTGKYRIHPDTENLHMYLRVLRQSRSFRNAVALVEEMMVHPPLGDGVQAKTFRIAMSCCVRENSNPTVVGHATKLFQMMIKSLEEPDFKVSQMFVDVIAHRETPWKDTLRGLRELQIVINNWRSLIAYGGFPAADTGIVTDGTDGAGSKSVIEEAAIYEHEADLDDTASPSEKEKFKTIRYSTESHKPGKLTSHSHTMIGAFVTRVIGAYDRLMHNAREEISPQERRECIRNSKQLQAWVSRHENIRRGRQSVLSSYENRKGARPSDPDKRELEEQSQKSSEGQIPEGRQDR